MCGLERYVWRLCVSALLLAGLCIPASHAQNLRVVTRFGDVPIAAICSAAVSDSPAFRSVLHAHQTVLSRGDEVCRATDRDAPPLQELRRPLGDPSPFLPSDSIDDQLRAMGSAGVSIANARQEVAQILRENSSCSSWYAQAEPDPARKFETLHFRIDDEGESTFSVSATPRDLYYRDPYVARAQEDVGRGSVITINAHGAFFRLRAATDLNPASALVLGRSPQRFLHVADYLGGSLKAQVATILHEYGHIIGLLPVDSPGAGGELLSMQNTKTVLHYCRKQIEASTSRTIIVRR